MTHNIEPFIESSTPIPSKSFGFGKLHNLATALRIKQGATTRELSRYEQSLIVALTFVVFVTAFWIAPLSGGEDWSTFLQAAHRLAEGQSPYDEVNRDYYVNPPHLAALLSPFTLLPFRLSLAIALGGTVTLTLLLIQRWCTDNVRLKFLLTMFSPPMLFILLLGQVDVLLLAGVFLPQSCWALVAITKPQAVAGLVFGIRRKHWPLAAALVAVVLVLSFSIFPHWPQELLKDSGNIQNTGRNYWLDLWPFQVPLGLYFVLRAVQEQDERLLVAGSPFLVPYATTASFIGVWIVALSSLNRWQSVLLLIGWWGVIMLRLLA